MDSSTKKFNLLVQGFVDKKNNKHCVNHNFFFGPKHKGCSQHGLYKFGVDSFIESNYSISAKINKVSIITR